MKTGKKPWKRTGLSRAVLLTLDGREDGLTVDEITAALAERPGPRETEVSSGAVWVVVERARQNGLISCNKREQKRPYIYVLTDGGRRRIKWIKAGFKARAKPGLRVVANPKAVEEE